MDRGTFAVIFRFIPSSSPFTAAVGSAGRRGERSRLDGAGDTKRNGGRGGALGWDAVRVVKRTVPLPLD